ncbi:hypothetical protein ACFQH9_02185 [Pseudonocardia lutea]|uniref:Transposase n=1 Tax=Pseudonocardia lutea TaxID=2172015 RepID=A0ABW1I0F4_9PSEU
MSTNELIENFDHSAPLQKQMEELKRVTRSFYNDAILADQKAQRTERPAHAKPGLLKRLFA